MISWNVNGREEGFSSEVASYLESNGTLNQYEFTYDELLKMLNKQYPKSENTAYGWGYLENNREKAISEVSESWSRDLYETAMSLLKE